MIRRLAALLHRVTSNPYALGTAGLVLLGRSLQGIVEHAQVVADDVTKIEATTARSLQRSVEMATAARTAADESVDALRTARSARNAAQAARNAARQPVINEAELADVDRAGDVDRQAPAEASEAG